MSALREQFEEEICQLGAGIPEIREKVNHIELEYDRVTSYLRDLREKFDWEKRCMKD